MTVLLIYSINIFLTFHCLGAKTVVLRQTGSDNHARITACFTVNAAGDKLPVMLVYKAVKADPTSPKYKGPNPVERELATIQEELGLRGIVFTVYVLDFSIVVLMSLCIPQIGSSMSVRQGSIMMN